MTDMDNTATDTCAHAAQQVALEPPGATQPVHKEDCMLCFDTPDAATGLSVCLHCFEAGCTGDEARAHAGLHAQRTGHALFATLKRTPKPREQLTRLAVAAETEGAEFEYSTELDALLDAVVRATSSEHRDEVRAWEEEIVPCEHTRTLAQLSDARPALADARCASCGLTTNLWLCLTCGHLGCGRAQFGGTDGQSHGLAHFEATGHPCSVKQGTITAEGAADLYCYACNDARLDPSLGAHLQHLGLNVASMSKTEKSMTELQLEHNAKFDFNMTDDDGQALQPLYGPGHTGVQNLGNSCYLASSLQALMAVPAVRMRYADTTRTHSLACARAPGACLECQLGKVADGLLSGRYAVPAEPPVHAGIRPTSLKALVGQGHAEFAGMRQQDADEFLKHLVALLQADARQAEAVRPFAFALEHRLQCDVCHRVRYTREPQDIGVALPVPVRELGAHDGVVQYAPVALQESLELFVRAESLPYECAACARAVTATKQTRFATFPDVLVVQAQRFQLVNWVPQKVNVPFVVPLDAPIDLAPYLGHGLQPGEELLPDDERAAPAAAPAVDAEALLMLTSMGCTSQ
ncbi:ubiquitinyl hydrolase 1 [Malassezia sp. CBS 17886]|nr:ubiquitinyl hydrolase 1 [Malassezia sp. CBS 17886]